MKLYKYQSTQFKGGLTLRSRHIKEKKRVLQRSIISFSSSSNSLFQVGE